MDAQTIHEAGSGQFPRKGSNGSRTGKYYTVEVRMDYSEPKLLSSPDGRPFVVDREWRTLPVDIIPNGTGVPSRTFSKHADQSGLMTWECANAIRWWAHAAIGLCAQTRLVAHELKENYSITTLGYYDVMGGGGNDDASRAVRCPVTTIQTEALPMHRPSKA